MTDAIAMTEGETRRMLGSSRFTAKAAAIRLISAAVLALVLVLCASVLPASAAPLAPTDVKAVGGGSTEAPLIARVTWTASTGATGYNIYRSVTESWADGTWKRIGSSGASPFDDVTGIPGQDYWYKVSAYDAAGSESVLSASTTPAVCAAWTQNPHGTYTSSTDNCKACHEPHVAATAQYILRQTGVADAMYGVCFACHDGTGSSANTNIKRYYPVASGGLATQAADTNYGHKIQTAGGTIAVGEGLPCYNCHNPHSSTEPDCLRVETSIAGVKYILGDAADGSEIDMTTDAGVRLFCFTCHTGDKNSTDTTVWGTNSAGTGFTDTIVAADKVEGISRLAYDSTAKTGLRLPPLNGHYTDLGAQGSCYQCHIKDYSTATSNNVHNPGVGLSPGGIDCYACHIAYQTNMEDGITTGGPTKAGADRALSYHHVMGSATNDGDKAFAPGSYPTSTTDVYCMSCHTDHDKFNSAKASNLRPDIATLNPTGVATDYDSTTDTGVCTACHATSLTKQVGTDQKDDGSTATPIIAAGAGAGQFGASAHDYYATSSYGAATFSANCSKCHNDEQTKAFQTSATRFGTHWSAARRILSALGGTVADPLAETHCYRCHSRTTDAIGGTVKAVALRDYYDATAMTAAAERVWAQFQLAGSSHPVVADANGSVECESCHNAHVVNTTTGRVTDPDNTYNTVGYGNDANQVTFCLKCHDGTLPTYTVSGTVYIPYSVTQANTTLNNKSANGARGHWSIVGAIDAGQEVSCAECHDNHGSAAPKLLGAYDMTDSRNEIAGAAITANDNSVCAACHTAATGTTYTRLANGYPNVGTWPGTTVYDGATGIHRGAGVVWPSSGLPGGDCKNCHNVHGTASPYDETVAQFGPSAADDNYTLCFTCHDGSPSTRNIQQYFPVADGGGATQTASTNYGHKIQTAGGTIAVGEGLPCYDCHNPHGSAEDDGLLVETSIGGVKYWIGDAATEIDMTTAAGNRLFCFSCHTGDAGASDTTVQGTSSTGTGFVNIADNTDYIEGIDRYDLDTTNKTGLHLPALNGHYTTLGSQGACYTCHGNAYSSSTSNNVHNPGPGGSNGGIDCYGCHAYQAAMEDDNATAPATKTGADNALSYHHVLGSATNDGDKAFAAGSYPDSTTDVYCLSCHVDHDKFNSAKASNLRPDITTLDPAGASTDYTNTGTYGICVNCHATARTKQGMGTEQKDDGSTTTPVISGAPYGASAHYYKATSSFGGSIFSADCSKCHNDEQTKAFQTSTNKFGTHWSAARRLLAAFGATADPPVEENVCYACHSLAADGFKAADNLDWYGLKAMDAPSQNIYAAIQSALPGTTYSSTKLNFWASADGTPSGNAPTGDQSGDTYAAGTWQVRTMDPRDAVAVYESYDTNAVSGASGTQNWRRVRFVSPPVAASVDVAAAAWTVAIYDREAATSNNARLRPYIYVWRADNATKVQIVAAANFGTEMPTTALPGGLQSMTTAAGAAVTLAPGDKIVVDVAVQTLSPTTTTPTMTYSWGSDAAGSLTAPTAITWDVPSPGGSGHKVGATSGVHFTSATDETRTYLSANKHVECTDCHNVHASGVTLHTRGTNAVAATSPLAGASGVDAAYTANSNWALPTSYSEVTSVAKEYQVCFRCHSGYNTNVTSWGGTGAGAWTDVALEFNPNNAAYHPVVLGLPATDPSTAYGSSRLEQADMRAAGTITTGGQTWSVGGFTVGGTMYCSDCHSSGSTPAAFGPHGSAVKWMLAGPNKAWPYQGAANNGKTSGTYWTYGNMGTGLDTTDGLFCRNCHIITGTAHTTSQHSGAACVTCHIRVPHGGKTGRLIAAYAAAPPSNMPARYSGNGIGGLATAGRYSTGFNKSQADGSPTSACQMTGCTNHGTTINSEPEW